MRKKLSLVKIHQAFIRMPNWLFILLMVLSKYMILIVFFPAIMFIVSITGEIGGPTSLYEGSPIVTLLFGVIIGPAFETFLCQKSIIKLSRKVDFISKRVWLQIVISSVVFGVLHWYSLAYIIIGFLGGLVLAYSYIVFEDKKTNPFWYVVCIHGLLNLFAIIYTLYIEKGMI